LVVLKSRKIGIVPSTDFVMPLAIKGRSIMPHSPTLASLAADLASGRTSARDLVEACLAKIADPAGEGARVFISGDADGARAAADAMDGLRKANAAPSPFAGIPISIKDLFDIKGQVTRAGSKVLDGQPAATADAPVVARLRRAGFVVIGRSNMTEFAYSGIGINPHYGTPKSAWQREVGHVPGGSSSGAAVSVAAGMVHGALGTDTGGSCRIPAAFNGIVGYKPTTSRIPTAGAVPLSSTLDSFGPLARSVACCATMDAVLAGEEPRELKPRAVKGLRLGVPTTVVLDTLDDAVGAAFARAIATLEAAGAVIERIALPEFNEVEVMLAKGGFSGAESFAWHRALLAKRAADYDPRVVMRIRKGEAQSGVDYVELIAARKALIANFAARCAPFDALAMPTSAIVPPRIADLIDDDDAFTKANLRALRNCTLINYTDGCSISLPVERAGEPPVGLMLTAAGGSDHHLFEVAAGVEAVVCP
jgi:aspartyl-tRNA(Asn)/glutamyl-tRNA(Gln) amidotransferase subunit A